MLHPRNSHREPQLIAICAGVSSNSASDCISCRALSNVAEEGLLKEGFFWIPSLGGPTSLAAQKAVSNYAAWAGAAEGVRDLRLGFCTTIVAA